MYGLALICRYTFTYLFAFFLLADGLNTTGFVIGIVQNEHIAFSFLQSTYLGLSQAATSTLSCYVFWYIQRHYRIPTKWMFAVTNVITVLIPLWGMVSGRALLCTPPSRASTLTDDRLGSGRPRSVSTTPGNSGSIMSSSVWVKLHTTPMLRR